MTPGVAAALGVGEYELKSYLNQPLDMEVSLHEVGDLTAEEILVNLASQEEFDAVGVDRIYFLNRLEFSVEMTGQDQAVLHIQTDQPVREPYLNFLVEFLWPTGRLMREYTVLLDPPSFADSAATAAPTITRAPQPVARTEPEPAPSRSEPQQPAQPVASSRPEPTAEPAVAPSQPAASSNEPRSTYTVRPSDTMWRIALDNRPTDSVSVQQMLMAIQKMNPDAFIDNNVNLVREGTVLRIPNEQEVRNTPTRSAIVEVADQNRKWREMLEARGVQVPQQRAQLDGSRQVADSEGDDSGPASGQVKLVSPESASAVADGDSTGSSREGTANTAVLENELAIRDENLDRLDRENAELKSRLEDLEEQTRTSEELLKLRNDQIAQLQEELRKLREAQGLETDETDPLMAEPAELESTESGETANGDAGNDAVSGGQVAGSDPAADQAEGADTGAEGDSDTASDDELAAAGDEPADLEGADGEETVATGDASSQVQDDASAEASAPAVTKAPEVAKPEPVAPAQPPAQQQGGGIVGLIMDNLLYIGAGLIVLLLLVLLVLRGKKKDDGDADADGALFDDLEDDDQDDAFGLNLEDESAGTAPVAEADDQEEPATAGQGGQDPMEDVEVYVAYGRYPQAVDFLRNEINKQPERDDLKVRLLELLKEMNDDAAFQQQVTVFAGTSQEVDQAIARLGGQADSAGQEEELSLDDLEMGLSSDLDEKSSVPTMEADTDDVPTMESDASTDELADFDFELDDASGKDNDDTTLMMDAEAPASADDDFSLDFEDDNKQERALSEADQNSLGADPVLELDDVSSASLDEGDTEFGDLNLDDMSDEFNETGEADKPDEELDLSLDDLDLDGPSDSEGDDDTLSDLDVTLELDEAEKSLESDSAGDAGADDLEDITALDLDMPEGMPEEEPGESAGEPEAPAEDERSLDDLLSTDGLDIDGADDSASFDEPETAPAAPAFEAPEPAEESQPAPAADDAPKADGDVLGDEDDFDFLGETDENATKLDLAKAYIDMGDAEGAKDILSEVIAEGNDQQQAEARELMGQVG
ncbi:MAG: hypothetical protein MI745_11850 [Pseudomonadales bacterium]|nr:hypothetical protein [Pseudomonadales bacterium]